MRTSCHLHLPGARQRGMVLISALLLLLVATILAVSMFRSFNTEEKIAGNLREKERAVHAAEAAQQYAEWWLSSGTANLPGTCNSIVDFTIGQVCSNSIAGVDFSQLSSWTYGVTYEPTDAARNMSIAISTTPGTSVAAGTTFYSAPMFIVSDVGAGAGGEIYQVDALGYGGTANTVAVVESTYVVTSSGHCADVIC
jgi:type IV pilus assembly protein PilX